MDSAIFVFVLAAQTAWASLFPNCDTLANVRALLEGKYGEEIVAQGISTKGRLVMWYGNRETESWSVVTVIPNGLACLNANGADLTVFEVLVGDES
jgi:hypothetical protein